MQLIIEVSEADGEDILKWAEKRRVFITMSGIGLGVWNVEGISVATIRVCTCGIGDGLQTTPIRHAETCPFHMCHSVHGPDSECWCGFGR